MKAFAPQEEHPMLKHLLVGAVFSSSVALAGTGYQSPPPPPGMAMHQGPQGNSKADDRIDAMRASRLLSEFEAAAAGHDRRAMASVDARFQEFVNQEIAEVRMERGRNRWRGGETQRTVNQLEDLQRQVARLAGRVDRRSVNQKRTLYTQANSLAQAELRDFGHRRG
jgi:hypothetical protein